MRLRWLATASVMFMALSCDGSSADPDGGTSGTDAMVADASRDGGPPPPTPGSIDPTFGEAGHTELSGGTIMRVVPRQGGGVAIALGGSVASLDGQGALVAQENLVNVRGVDGLAPLSEGRWLALVEPSFTSPPLLVRLNADLTRDESFSAPSALAGLAMGGSLAVDASSGSIFVAATRGSGSTSRVALRKLTSEGALDESFGSGGTAEALLEGIDVRGPVRILADGTLAVLSTRGFTPCVARFGADGAPVSSFGADGVLVLDQLGPRYPRALEVDSAGRLVVLGMSSDTIQLARVSAEGSLDATFGTAGVATASITRPTSSAYRERLEARALALQPDGALLVVGSFELDEPPDGTPDDEDLVVVRFTPDGSADSSFDGDGAVRLDVGPGVSQTRTWARSAVVDGRLIVGGEHLRDGTWLPFVAAVVL